MPQDVRPRFVDVVADAGISYRQADHWCRRGYINTRCVGHHVVRGIAKPCDQYGTGHSRYIEDDEIEVLLLMARLVKAGFTPEAAAHLARKRSPLMMTAVRTIERLQQRIQQET